MSAIGVMAMPADFRYRDVFLRGMPQHDLYDAFRIRHPRMDTGKRAKIFSPFDALKGFNEVVASKNVQYTDRTELTEEDRKRLNRQLHILKGLTFNSRMARANRVIISVTYYVPCSDENNEAFGLRGQYQTLTGVCWNVDEHFHTILVDRVRISFDDLIRIENNTGVFQKEWEAKEP